MGNESGAVMHLGGQQERLGSDPLHMRVKVGSNKIRKFQARFVNDMVTERR